MTITVITFEDFLAETEADSQATSNASVLDEVSSRLAEEFAPLFSLGETIESAEALERFEGVRQNLVREVRGEMCTLEQAVAYLENFELHLLQEQDKTA